MLVEVALRDSSERAIDQVGVDAGKGAEVVHRHCLVALVHGGVQQPELDHRTERAKEARVRGAAGGRQLWHETRLVVDRGREHGGKRARFGQERRGDDRLPMLAEVVAGTAIFRILIRSDAALDDAWVEEMVELITERWPAG